MERKSIVERHSAAGCLLCRWSDSRRCRSGRRNPGVKRQRGNVAGSNPSAKNLLELREIPFPRSCRGNRQWLRSFHLKGLMQKLDDAPLGVGSQCRDRVWGHGQLLDRRRQLEDLSLAGPRDNLDISERTKRSGSGVVCDPLLQRQHRLRGRCGGLHHRNDKRRRSMDNNDRRLTARFARRLCRIKHQGMGGRRRRHDHHYVECFQQLDSAIESNERRAAQRFILRHIERLYPWRQWHCAEDNGRRQTWSLAQSPASALNAMKFISSSEGWVVGDSGKIFTTNTGGTQWARQLSGVTAKLLSVDFLDAQNGITIGNGGIILTTKNGGLTGVKVFRGSVPLTIALEQNYPNPFNPATTISFAIPSRSFVSLKVFDVLGREVSTIYQKNCRQEVTPGNGMHRPLQAGSISIVCKPELSRRQRNCCY